MKKIIVIFDSEVNKDSYLDPITGLDLDDYIVESWDVNVPNDSKGRKKAFSFLYNHGTDKTPLYLFTDEKDGKIYNSHYFEHGQLTKDLALRKLKNE